MALRLSGLSKKNIPTILGLLVLFVGLIAGVFLVQSGGTTSFLPRASPQTTPKNLKITNVTDTSFTVSWQTDSSTVGFVRLGTNASNLTSTSNDDRDQTSGSTGLYKTHHVTVRALQANTVYYFKIGTGTRELYDNNGTPYTATTTSAISSQAKTIYGQVLLPAGSPAAGALVYVSADNLAPMSAIVQSSGSWVLSLAQARTKDLKSGATLAPATPLSLLVLSAVDTSTSVVTVTLTNSQPVPPITLGQNSDFTVAQVAPTPTPTGEAVVAATPAPAEVQSKFTSALLAPPTEAKAATLSITYPATDSEIVTVTSPQLKGTAPAGNRVTLTLKGKTTQTNTVTTDPSGIWTYTPLSKLTNGNYTFTASSTIESVKQTATRTFVLDLSQAGSVPSFTASDSGKTTATPTPTPKPTAISTASAQVSHPSTKSGQIVSGNETPTLILVITGMLLLIIGTGLWLIL